MNLRVIGLALALASLTHGVVADVRDDVRTLAEAHVAEGKILGAVVAAKGFAPLAVGNRVVDPSPIPMDAETRFDCASVTKTVVAMACARLAAQGKIDVDRPFTDYLTDHALAKEGCAITVRDLALHVGGFRGDIRYQQQKDYGEFRRVAMELRPAAPRGSYEYECINMIYVGWIVEKVTGMDLAAAAKKLVLEPLGMTHSCWGPLAADANVAFIPIALMHLDIPVWKKHYNAGLGWPSDPGANFAAPHPIGNAGLFSTAGDLLLFVRDLAERRRFEPRAYDLVLTCGYEKDGVRRSFGFDMTTGKMPRGVSRQAISHTGWSGQTIVADPGTGFYGVVLTARKSMEHGKCRRAREDLMSLMATAPVSCRAGRAAMPEELFRNPPPEAHAGVWWHWMGAQVTEEGIRKDLDWFQRTGITSATVFGMADSCTPWAKRIGKVPTDGLRPFDARWWKLFAFACREGKRRGIDIGLHNCPGYTSTGGAWIPSRLSMRELVFNVTNATKQISTASRADFPVFNEDTKRYERPPCPARQTDVVDIGSARGGVKVSHIPMGAFVQPADWDSFGLECDKMNPEAVDFHLDHVIGELKRHLGKDLPAAGLGHVLLDSYEAGTPSWTPHMREEFTKRRGYDPLEFLPIVGGMTNLYTAAEVKKFKADFDRTLKDLYRDVLFKRMYERFHAEGVEFACEPYGGPFTAPEVAPYIDRIMTEFWFAPPQTFVGRCGYWNFPMPDGSPRRILEAEAFTGQPKNCEWVEMPANLKPATDAAFLAGVNRLILHTNPLQPWGDDVKPGVTMGRWGTHFGRNQTWAECGKAWFDYIARCQALLQWGEPCDKRLKLEDARQVARTDGTRTIYFVVLSKTGESRFYDDKADKWYDPVTGAEFAQTALDRSRTLADFTPAVGDRSQSSDPTVRYFSGTQTYRTRFDLPKAVKAALRFTDMADQVVVVRVNGRPAGTAWCAPWTVDLPVEALKAKGNELEVDVTNSWRNRLIGDEQEPADCEFEKAPLPGGWFLREYPEWFRGDLANRPSKGRKCFSTWNYFTKDSKLLPSGLITPPTLTWTEQ